MLTAVACNSKSDSDINYNYDDDTAITAFTLGTVAQKVHTTGSQGQDSVYTVNITGSNYKFFIDQQKRLIWNPDSLPYGCDATKILATISAMNGASIRIINLDDANAYKVYSSTDSIDFSQDRKLRVVAQSGRSHRDYTVRVGVRKVKEGTLAWEQCAPTDLFASASHLKGLVAGGKVYVFAGFADKTLMCVADAATGNDWTEVNQEFAADAWDNVAATDNDVWMMDGNTLRKVTVGRGQIIGKNLAVVRLIGAVGNTLYGLDAQGTLMSSANDGTTWQPEALDDDESLIPTSRISLVSKPLDAKGQVQRLLLAGYRDFSSPAAVWTRLSGTGFDQLESRWSFTNLAGDLRYALPNWEQLSVVVVEGNFVAVGISGSGALAPMLVSKDQGITWKHYDGYAYPSQLSAIPNVLTAFADENDKLWIVTDKNVLRQVTK